MTNKKTIICLYGGPGTGKSTTAALVYGKLKQLDYNAEINREYIKDWVWEGRELLPLDQLYLYTKQARKEMLYMKNKLDYIITDSPLTLNLFYCRKYCKYNGTNTEIIKLLLKQHKKVSNDLGYKVEHIFLNRKKEYNPDGRLQTEEEAVQFDTEIKELLDELGYNYKTVDCNENVANKIIWCLNDQEIEE